MVGIISYFSFKFWVHSDVEILKVYFIHYKREGFIPQSELDVAQVWISDLNKYISLF